MIESTGKKNGPDTDETIPWYLKIPIGEDDDEGEWEARPYFGKISIEKGIRDENVLALSQVDIQVDIEIEALDTPKKTNPAAKNARVQLQNNRRVHNPPSISTPFDDHDSETWYHPHRDTHVDISKRDNITANEDVFSINIPRSQSQLNINTNSPERNTSEEAIVDEKEKKGNTTEITNIFKQKSAIEYIFSNDQFLERSSHKQEQSLPNTFPSTGIHDWYNPIDQPYERQLVLADASNHKNRQLNNLFKESSEFQPYNGTIDDLLKYSIPGSDLSHNKETHQLTIQYFGPISLCVYVQYKLLQWYQRLLVIQASKRKTDHNCTNSFVRAEKVANRTNERNNKGEEQKIESNATIENEACCKVEQRGLTADDKSELVNVAPILSLDQPAYSSEMASARSQLAPNMTAGVLEGVSPAITDEILALKDQTSGFSLYQCASSSSETLSTRLDYGAIMIDGAIEGISPVISREELAHNESGLENNIPGLSHDERFLSLTDIQSIKPELGVTTKPGVNERTSSGLTDIIMSSTQASISGIEVADFIKTLTSSFSQEGINDQVAFQLAQMALTFKYKEMSEIRRITLEERRRNEDICIKERRHQQKLKAMSHDLRSLRDEAQKACRVLRDNAVDICIGKHQILCILIVCGIRAFKQNWSILKELTSTTKIMSIFELISLWACNCTGETCESKIVGVIGHSYYFLVLRSLLSPSLSSVTMCSVLCILRIIFRCFLLAVVHKALNICKSPNFLHHLINCTVFTYTALHTDIGINMFASATIISSINFVVAIVAYTAVLVTTMKGRNLLIDEMEYHMNTINLASRTSSCVRLMSIFVSVAIGFISA